MQPPSRRRNRNRGKRSRSGSDVSSGTRSGSDASSSSQSAAAAAKQAQADASAAPPTTQQQPSSAPATPAPATSWWDPLGWWGPSKAQQQQQLQQQQQQPQKQQQQSMYVDQPPEGYYYHDGYYYPDPHYKKTQSSNIFTEISRRPRIVLGCVWLALALTTLSCVVTVTAETSDELVQERHAGDTLSMVTQHRLDWRYESDVLVGVILLLCSILFSMWTYYRERTAMTTRKQQWCLPRRKVRRSGVLPSTAAWSNGPYAAYYQGPPQVAQTS